MLMAIEIKGVRYYLASEVQESLGIARQTLWRWRKEMKIPQGRRYRNRQIVFSADEFEQISSFADRLEPALAPMKQHRKREREV
jgi:predicted DNA-binding transcriptional regulator AlpA